MLPTGAWPRRKRASLGLRRHVKRKSLAKRRASHSTSRGGSTAICASISRNRYRASRAAKQRLAHYPWLVRTGLAAKPTLLALMQAAHAMRKPVTAVTARGVEAWANLPA
jgi:hypothetical protein